MSTAPLISTGEGIDFEKIEVGAQARLSRRITAGDIEAFATLSGDRNPLHVDEQFARTTSFQRPVAHGMIVASCVSTLVGMHLPGPGALWTRQNFRWLAPVFANDTVEVSLSVTHKSTGSNTLTIEVKAVNQNGKTVMDGEGAVMMLERKQRSADGVLSERVALVTGGSRGIGAGIALALGQAGAAVAVNYRQSEQQAEQVCLQIREAGGRAIAVQGDVAEAVCVQTAAERAANAFGKPVDVLINNASSPIPPRAFLGMSWEEIQQVFNVQVRGAFLCAQAVLPGMIAQKSGRIVNIGSALTRNMPPPQWTALVTAKSALLGLTRSLAAEFGPQGVRVNMVSPGMTETDSIAGIPERLRKVQAMQTPLRRLAAAEDIARAVVFMCSEGGEFITGADVPVCGGLTA
jgi:3-oxoacyl-[acyl-carrier protein] reductase